MCSWCCRMHWIDVGYVVFDVGCVVDDVGSIVNDVGSVDDDEFDDVNCDWLIDWLVCFV